jgi:hypothetical protein
MQLAHVASYTSEFLAPHSSQSMTGAHGGASLGKGCVLVGLTVEFTEEGLEWGEGAHASIDDGCFFSQRLPTNVVL